MLKKVLTVVGLFCFMGWGIIDAAGLGSRVKAEKIATGGPAETKDGIKFVYSGKAENVFVAGSFNDWSTTKNPMKKVKENIWAAVIPLEVGKYQYKFVADGNWITDSENPSTTDDGLGGKNSLIVVTKIAEVKKIKSGPQATKDGAKFVILSPTASSVYLAGEFNNWSQTDDMMKKDSSGNWTIVKKLSKGKYQYKFVTDGNWIVDPGNPNTTDDGFGGKNSVIEVK